MTNQREAITSGNIANIVGKPTLNHSKKVKSKAAAAMAFGGEPTTVPFPPIFAAYAVP